MLRFKLQVQRKFIKIISCVWTSSSSTVINRGDVWCVRLCDSGIYNMYIETIEHIERDLQRFREVTKQLTYDVNKVR